MTTRWYVLVSTLLAGILPACAVAAAQPSSAGYGYASISPPHPALAGVETFRLSILRLGTRAENDGLDWAELSAMVSDKFRMAGIELPAGDKYGEPNTPELRIYIDMLKLEASQQYVFRIQTSLARPMHLTQQRTPVFKAEVWKLNPVMQAVSVEDMPAEVADVVLEQVNAFIRTYLATNRPAGPPGSDMATGPQEDNRALTKPPASEEKYVASNSSGIFHRPGCRWAGNISPENLVIYRTRDEAISSGKRPCKSCEP